MKLGLENIRKLLASLDNPEKNFTKVQVAGTNGKGSTCAFLEATCLSAKIKIGLYTSPHLISITERIKINGKEISETQFAKHATKIRLISEKLLENGDLEMLPTYFEQVTAIAISFFSEAKIELAILETGLGGRFDATTATNAEIVAITPIDFDHQDILGNTLAEIAAEKAAIIRAGTKVIIGKQKNDALEVVLKRCEDVNISPIIDNCIYSEENSPEVSFKTRDETYPNINLSLKGEHQFENACTAITLAEILNKEFNFKISRSDIINGLENARHSGRLEFYENILFDGAHNVAGAAALKKYLVKFQSDAKITFVFGAMKDKDTSEIAKILFPLAENLILTKPDNIRSEEPEKLREYAEKFIDQSKIFIVPTVADAIASAKQITLTYTATRNSFVCVTGSLYLIGEALKMLNNKS